MEFDVSPQTALGAVGSAFGAFGGWCMKVLTGRIVKVERSTVAALDRIETRAMAEISRVEREADQSFRDLWAELAQHRQSAHEFREKTAATLAALPTRAEMEAIIARVAGKK